MPTCFVWFEVLVLGGYLHACICGYKGTFPV